MGKHLPLEESLLLLGGLELGEGLIGHSESRELKPISLPGSSITGSRSIRLLFADLHLITQKFFIEI